MKRGQSIIVTVITTAGILLASVAASWGTANKTSSETKGKIDLVSQREELHYAELNKGIDRIEKKLDQLLEAKLTTKAK